MGVLRKVSAVTVGTPLGLCSFSWLQDISLSCRCSQLAIGEVATQDHSCCALHNSPVSFTWTDGIRVPQ